MSAFREVRIRGKKGVFLEMATLYVFEFWLIGSNAVFFRTTKCLKKGSESLQFEEDFDIILEKEGVEVSRVVLNWNIGLRLLCITFLTFHFFHIKLHGDKE